jgi:hypothetical protein
MYLDGALIKIFTSFANKNKNQTSIPSRFVPWSRLKDYNHGYERE